MYFLAYNACSTELQTILGYLKNVITLIKILIPVGLILLGTIDLGKAVMANDEKEIKSNQQLLVKRALAAVVVFLVGTIVPIVIGIVGDNSWQTCWNGAVSIMNPILDLLS